MTKEIDKMGAPFWIDPADPDVSFPDVSLALTDPDGLLAIGGDLTQERLLTAYRHGIFPWYTQDQPVLWWSPDPRFVLSPESLKISRSLRKTIRRQDFKITLNQCFDDVMYACAAIDRPGQDGTWITDEMRQSYQQLHQAGCAHSVEAWFGDQLVGGLYGVSIGSVFFGESMFSTMTDASKVAFAYFVKHIEQSGFRLIDCQVYTSHLQSLGAELITRQEFIEKLDHLCPLKDQTALESCLILSPT